MLFRSKKLDWFYDTFIEIRQELCHGVIPVAAFSTFQPQGMHFPIYR